MLVNRQDLRAHVAMSGDYRYVLMWCRREEGREI